MMEVIINSPGLYLKCPADWDDVLRVAMKHIQRKRRNAERGALKEACANLPLFPEALQDYARSD